MDNIKRCNRCILPESVPGISFDNEGICNYCREYERNFSIWNQIAEKKEKEFGELLERARKLKRTYDCLIPLSGGKDSTYALYLCSKFYGLRTLAVTFDNGFLTEPAKKNIENALSNCNADHIYYTLNRARTQELFRIFILRTGDFCNACMRGINFSIEIMVKNFNIPLVIKGSGRRVQYVSQIKGVTSLNTPAYFTNVIKDTESEKEFKYLSRGKNNQEFHKIAGGLCDILGISRAFLMKYVPQYVGLYDYIYKPFPEIVEIISKEMGWRDYAGSTEHLDCELHDVPFYKDTLRIEGITKHTFHRSGLIRQGLLTRNEALMEEEKELQLNFKNPPVELMKLLDKIHVDFEVYKNTVISSDKSIYEPNIQKFAREIYHKFRKF